MTSGPIPSPGRIAMSGIVSAPTLPCPHMRRAIANAVTLLLTIASGACGGEDKPAQSPSTATAQPATPPPPPDPATSSTAADPKNATPPATAGGGTWPFVAESAEDRAAQLERLKKDPGP